MILAYIPSPDQAVWHLGPVPIRASALRIIAVVAPCLCISERRRVARGGGRGTVLDVAVWAIPFGLVGARAYHVAYQPELYFSSGANPVEALSIWNGGIGIWGANSVGAVGADDGGRRRGAEAVAVAEPGEPAVRGARAV